MRAVLRLAVGLACLLNPPLSGAGQPAPDSPYARSLAQEAAEYPLGESFDAWRERYGQDFEQEPLCRRYRGMTLGFDNPEAVSPPHPWAIWCERRSAGVLNAWTFSAVREVEPFTARLEQWNWHLASGPARLVDFHRELESSLRMHLGDPQRLDLFTLQPDGRIVRGPDWDSRDHDVSWVDARRWLADDREVYLYRYARNDEPPELRLRVRSRALVENLESDQRPPAPFANPLEETLRTEAARRFPRFREFFSGGTPITQDRVRQGARDALEIADAASGEARLIALLVLDRVAQWIDHRVETPSPEQDPTIGPALTARLGFEFDGHEDSWHYPRSPLYEVWRADPFGEWGTYAFIELLNGGFGFGVSVDRSDPYEVARQGTSFLNRGSSERGRVSVMFAVALARETLWSMSLAPEYDTCVEDAAKLADDNSRRVAVELYQQVVASTEATDPRHSFARRRMLRLKAGYDTGARFFVSCVP